MASVIYLVTPELFAKGIESGAFVDDAAGIAPAWYPGCEQQHVPAGPVYVNPVAK